ncbi:hypothetical protein V7S43_005575 [Phytophthora oleae]|uniref:THH1/TOM1/TOM3 domain-containing protein n=1 Tax=Phytophthora oleae TaxID=2107226 RepID=A0ABD3FS33_9STRA
MPNITEATCDFGLAQTAAGCVRTLASYDPSAYRNYQIVYFVVGSVCLVASGVMYIKSIKHDGSPLQHANFPFCMYASATVLVRGIDPGGYAHIIPLPIFGLLSDTCTASLHSVYILALGYWATIIQQGAAITESLAHLRILERTAIIVVWVFYSVNDLVLLAFKGFQPNRLAYEELMGSAGLLGIISVSFLLYGLRVLGRLHEYERIKKLEIPTVLERTMENHSFTMALSDDEDGVPVITEPRYVARRPQNSHAAKIRKILIVAEAVSLVVIAGQMYMAVSRASETPVELSCANGMLCETVKTRLNLLLL